ncbi:MAG: rod shape-determining protein MreC [Proteobacteria bacterium]|nr:rod shape-determining protein MreC [Pseudomonadota bacterium]MBU1711234.1 rod shape-determining protein MreC [Pseudomonadota bacterium]
MRKRIQHKQQVKALLVFGIVLTLILILIVTTVGRKKFNSPHKLALEIVGSAQYAVSQVTSGFRSIWEEYIALLNIRDEKRRLEEKIIKLQATNNSYREAVAINARLTNLLEIKEKVSPPTITAQIIGKDPSLWFKTIIIDRGSSEGVHTGMPVVTGEGVIGQVLNTSPHYSKILLAIDPNSAIDGLIQETRVQGMVKGKDNSYEMQYVLKNAVVNEGDQIVTSGLGGVFPKGLPVGTVSKAVKSRRGMFQQIDIIPAVDFSTLEYVIIILTENPLTE